MSVAERKGLLGWLLNLFWLRPEERLEDKLQTVIIKIREHQESINEFSFRMQKRAEELYQKVMEHLKQSQSKALSDDERTAHYNLAKTFAEELVEIKKFIKAVRFVVIGLEKVAQRIQTVKDVKDLQAQLGPIRMLLTSIKQEVEGVFPSVGAAIDDINRSVAELMIHTSSGIHEVTGADTFTKDTEVDSIIKEAWAQAAASIESAIPELTALFQQRAQEQKAPQQLRQIAVHQKQAVPRAEEARRAQAGAAEPVGLAAKPGGTMLEEIEEAVLNEVKARKGVINVEELASKYGVSKDAIFQVLENLSRKGKIRIARAY